MLLRVGEKVHSKGRVLTVSEVDLSTLAKIRPYLIGVAATGTTVTYGELVAVLGLPQLPIGLGRILDLLSEDCFRREGGEPSLAALVVSGSTGEAGESYDGDPAYEREQLYAYWARLGR